MATLKRHRPRAEDFTIAWICALPLEYAAAKQTLDDLYEEVNEYTTGRIHNHEVVLVCLPAGYMGTNAAAATVARIVSTFPSLKAGLLVGIAGGVPSPKADIRLGDVVISQPEGRYGGVVQYDYGKTIMNGIQERTGSLNSPPRILLTAVSKVKSNLSISRKNISNHLATTNTVWPPEPDILFQASYNHPEGHSTCCSCSTNMLVEREPRQDDNPMIFFGTIASGNQVIKDGITRDRIRSELGGVLCFEMEAAGVMNELPCLVIRGICDYADSHKNKQFQPFAAATAAACAREILSYIYATQPASRQLPGPDQTELVQGQVQSQDRLTAQEKQALLASLNFEQIHARHSSIRMAHVKTCQWLPRTEKYQQWLSPDKFDEHHGFLWIKGKPGAGKSTLMKFAFGKAVRQRANVTVISFFFNARGEDLERSVSGMYRSLLFQLLEKVPDLLDVFLLVPKPESRGEEVQWEMETLKFLFRSAVEKLQDRTLVCYIDALDECDENQIRDMLSFFEQLGVLAVSEGFRLLVCLSSRHYPHIAIGKGLELVLEDQDGHREDISTYVHSELKAGRSKQVEKIKQEVISRASGVFLWVVLVVQILNKEHDRGRVHALKKRLAEIPDGLHELLKDILTRDNNNMEDTLLCIQWILFAQRPLTREELYFAIIGGTETDPSLLEWDRDETTTEDMKRFILDSSKGLAEFTKLKHPTVQFIHESVRDFLKGEGFRNLHANVGSVAPGPSHEALKRSCLNYVTIDLSSRLTIPDPLPVAKSDEAKHLREDITEKFPLLKYATQNIFYHADSALEHGICQKHFLESLVLDRWILKNNIYELHEVRRYTEDAHILYILAEKDLANLLSSELDLAHGQDVTGQRYGHPLSAAVAQGNEKAVHLLLRHEPFAKYAGGKEQLKCLIRDAVRSGKRDIVQSLLENASGLELTNDFLRTTLCATRKVSFEVGRLLLQRSSNPDTRDLRGRTLLSYAAERSSPEVVKLLLDRGDNPDSEDATGCTPLVYAVLRNSGDVTRLLLDRGSNSDAKDNRGRTPLSYAAGSRVIWGIIELLLEKGADPNAKDNIGWTPLFYAIAGRVRRGFDQLGIVSLLLKKGGDPNVKDRDGRTPLSCAADGGIIGATTRVEILGLLLEKNGDPNAKDNDGHTPLTRAVMSRDGDSLMERDSLLRRVRTLLAGGADPNSQNLAGRTPLFYAVGTSRIDVVRLLLGRGAQVNLTDHDGHTPLCDAIQKWDFSMKMLLLERGAVPLCPGHFLSE